MTPALPAGFSEVMDEYDRKHSAAHERHRARLDEQGGKIESNYEFFRDRSEADRRRMDRLEADLQNLGRAPVNVDKILFTPKIVLSTFGIVATVVAIFLTAISGVKSDVRDIGTRMEAKQAADKSRQDLEDLQMQTLRQNVDELKRQVQLIQYDNQTLKDLVRKKGG